MKEKILAAIKAKFPNAKLSAKRLEALAATIEAKAGTDETLIDSTLDALNELYPIADIAKDDHIRSTLEGKLKATQPKPPKDPIDELDVPALTPDDTPAWAKVLVDSNKTLLEKVTKLEGDKVKNAYQQKADVDLKDIPLTFRKLIPVPTESDEAYDTWKDGVIAAYAEHQKELTDTGLAIIPKPGVGTEKGKTPLASAEEVKAVVDSIT